MLLVCGYSNRYKSTPTKLSAIRGESHSRTFLVITATPLQTMSNVGFKTPSSDKVARQARTIRSGFIPSTIWLSPNETKHRTRTGDKSSGDIRIIFLINLRAWILSSSFFSKISKLRHTKYGSWRLLNVCRSCLVFNRYLLTRKAPARICVSWCTKLELRLKFLNLWWVKIYKFGYI